MWAVVAHGSVILQQLSYAVTYLTPAYFLWPMALLFTIAAVISTAVELTEQEISRHADSRMIQERSELAMQSYESMRVRNEQVRMLRHDMIGHFTTLRQMTSEPSVGDYLDKLIGQNEKLRAVVRSGNQMLDIILSAKLSQAMDAGDLFRGSLGHRYPPYHGNLLCYYSKVGGTFQSNVLQNGKSRYVWDSLKKSDRLVAFNRRAVPSASFLVLRSNLIHKCQYGRQQEALPAVSFFSRVCNRNFYCSTDS